MAGGARRSAAYPDRNRPAIASCRAPVRGAVRPSPTLATGPIGLEFRGTD